MKRRWMFVLWSVLFLAGLLGISAQAQPAEAQKHVAAARALAYEPGFDYTFSFETICAEPKPAGARGVRGGGGGGGGQRGDGGQRDGGGQRARGEQPQVGRRIPPRNQWYFPPNKLFDNMYYVGSDNNSVYAITTSDGIILVNAGEYFAVEAEIVDGFKTLGLDPTKIKYVLIADAREPSYSGAKYLQDHYNAKVLASEADWNVMGKAQIPEDGRPKKDMVVTDGQKLTLGDTMITIYVTPGHTPGTLSMIVPLKDGGQRHTAALLGGRDPLVNGEGVQYFPTELEATKAWKASVVRFQDIAAKAGADVFLITRGQNDHLPDRIRGLNYRRPGASHPFVSKDSVKRYMAMTVECMDAQLAWLAAK
jgi:metallo-beta-lactamase class B